MSNPRTPIKRPANSGSDWRSAVKAKCMAKLRESRAKRQSLSRTNNGNGNSSQMAQDNDDMDDTEAGTVRQLLRAELCASGVDADWAARLEQEMLDELAATGRGMLRGPGEKEEEVEVERQVEEWLAAEEREKNYLARRVCLKCGVGVLTEVSPANNAVDDDNVMREDATTTTATNTQLRVFVCRNDRDNAKGCGLQVETKMEIEDWVEAVHSIAMAHTGTCPHGGQVVLASEAGVGNFLACTFCDYFGSV